MVAQPLVSVIVPVYNAGAALEDCVRSILDQDYPSLEVLLVDDGSTDDSGEICDLFAASDSRVIVLHQANAGIAAAQNAGLDAATGALITFCDNDDLMMPTLVTRLVAIMEHGQADMSCCRWLNVGASVAGAVRRERLGAPAGVVVAIDDPARAYQTVFSRLLRKLQRSELRYFSEANWGKLYRRELFDTVRFPVGRYAQDVAVAMPLYLQMSRVASCEDALYLWVQHPGSVSHHARSTRYFHDIIRAHGGAFDAAMAAGILPARAYGGMKTLDLERASVRSADDARLYAEDVAFVRARLGQLRWRQRLACAILHRIRRAEVLVYRWTVHRRK